MSSKPREHFTCMKVMIHTPCSFGSIITLCKNKPEHHPKAPSAAGEKAEFARYSASPRPTVRSFRCSLGGSMCGKKTNTGKPMPQCEEHCINVNSEAAMPSAAGYLFCGLSV